MNEQETFWADSYAVEYIRKNSEFDEVLGVKAWQRMLAKTEQPGSILECGCNIGRNISVLNRLYPDVGKSIIEISKPAFRFVTERNAFKETFNGSIVESRLAEQYDLVFTMGVLIHIAPENLLANMKKLYEYSKRYILIGEYFSRAPVMIEYQGKADKLFKRDFGKLFMQNHDVKLIDYGFLWGHLFDAAGFDDITWWLFSK